MMTLHKLSAGNGYTYLIKQVASNDAPATGYANLAEYYSEHGESPVCGSAAGSRNSIMPR